jgi:hypothetical protein
MRYIIFSLCFIILLSSCVSENKAKKADAATFYATIQSALIFYHDEQQEFIDQSTRAIHEIRSGIRPDTKELRALLDSAVDGNRSRYNMVVNATEVDPEIGYKEKMIDYINVFNSAYNNEFKEFITMLESDISMKEREKHMEQQLKPKLLLIKEKEMAVREAKEQMLRKYDLYEVNDVMDEAGDELKRYK